MGYRSEDIEWRTEKQREYAETKYGPFTSTHEGYGVLCEEVEELLQAIRNNNPEAVFAEAIQVAAVAQRIAECVTLPASRRRSGMGELK